MHMARERWIPLAVAAGILVAPLSTFANEPAGAAQDRPEGVQQEAAGPAEAAHPGLNLSARSMEYAQTRNSTSPRESSCFTLGSDDPPAEGQKLIIPKQVICPFFRFRIKPLED